MHTVAIYPGTFDPITYGHVDIIERAAKLFDKVIVGVAINSRKAPDFSLEKRTELAKLATQTIPTVQVYPFSGLLINFARQHHANIIIRGLRAMSDFEYELQLAGMNRRMAADIETIFLAPAEQYALISSTIVREIIRMEGDISSFVPPEVAMALKK